MRFGFLLKFFFFFSAASQDMWDFSSLTRD